MPVAILENLTEEEAQSFIANAAHRHPAIVLTARARDDGPTFDVVADESDATNYADIIEAIVRSGVPLRFSVASTERKIAGCVRDALQDGSIAEGRNDRGSPLDELCTWLEWRLVPYLVPSLPSDGFDPKIIGPIERGVRMEGACWFLPESWEGRFRAEIALDANDALARFDLVFGDIASMKTPAPTDDEPRETIVHGFRVTEHRGGRRRFTCRILKAAT